MSTCHTRSKESRELAVKNEVLEVACSRNPKRQLQTSATTMARLFERDQHLRDYALTALAGAARHAGLNDQEIRDGIRAAVRFARLGVIRTNRRRGAEEAA